MELLIGAGHSRHRRVHIEGELGWKSLVTLDMNPDTKPDIVHDLSVLPYPIETSRFDEIHAYEVLEHVGKQGDWQFFFAQFDEFARILKPQGVICITSPTAPDPWVWGDPGHTRYMGAQVYTFLVRKEYEKQLGNTSMTDYRRYFSSDWEIVHCTPKDAFYVLRNLKES